MSTCSRSWRHRQAPSSPGRRRPRTGADTGTCFAPLNSMLLAAAPGRSRAPAATAPGWPASSLSVASWYSRSAAHPAAERRVRGKNDTLDAVGAARAALASDRLALPRSGERREALRLLLVARRSAVDVRREALTQLRAVIVTAPDELRQELRGLPPGKLLERCRRLRQTRAAGRRPARDTARAAKPRPPDRGRDRPKRTSSNARSSPTCGRSHRQLLDEPGVGPIVAAQLIVSLVAPRPRPLRSSLRAARRRRPDPRLKRPNHPVPAQPRRRPPTQPCPPHRHPPPTAARPSHQGLHRTPRRRRQRPAATPSASSSATSPATSTALLKPRSHS